MSSTMTYHIYYSLGYYGVGMNVDSELLLKNLLAPGFDYVRALCSESIKGDNDRRMFHFTQLLLNFYQNYNRSVDLLKWAMLQQVQTTTRAEELLREGSIATNLLYHFFHIDQMGTRYLHMVLHPLVEQVEAHPEIYKIEKEDGNADHNLDLLFSFLSEFLERLIGTVNFCPLYIREGFLYFQKEAAKKFPEAKAIASSIIFLRFILPALISPHHFKILSSPPTTQKGLIMAARVMQSIANMCEFDHSKCSNYSKLNSFIVKMFDKMDTFISTLLDEEQIQRGKTIIEATVPFKPSSTERNAALRDITRFLLETYEDPGMPLAVLSNRRKSPEEMQRRVMDLNNDNWKQVKAKKGSTFFSLRTDGTPLAICKFTAAIDWSYETLFEHLYNFDEHKEFFRSTFPYIQESVVKRHNPAEMDCYQSLNFPFPLTRRDMVMKSYGVLGGNVSPSYITMYSTKTEEFPEKKGYVRIEAHVFAFIIEPTGCDSCNLTGLFYIDMKGSLPQWVKNLFSVQLLHVPINILRWTKDHKI